MRSYHLTVKNRIAVGLLVALGLGIGAVMLVFGLALLLALFVGGVALGTGLMIYRALTGRQLGLPRRTTADNPSLDPSLEVFPERQLLRQPDETPPPKAPPND